MTLDLGWMVAVLVWALHGHKTKTQHFLPASEFSFAKAGHNVWTGREHGAQDSLPEDLGNLPVNPGDHKAGHTDIGPAELLSTPKSWSPCQELGSAGSKCHERRVTDPSCRPAKSSPFGLYSVKFRPYIGLIYGRYLQFRFLKWPLRTSHSKQVLDC
jgi:hypothetical protein